MIHAKQEDHVPKSTKQWSWSVYVLHDPHSGLPQRVGVSRSLRMRLQSYRSCKHGMSALPTSVRTQNLASWLDGLRQEGIRPICKVVSVVSSEDLDTGRESAHALERFWIRKMFLLNPDLMNCMDHPSVVARKLDNAISTLEDIRLKIGG